MANGTGVYFRVRKAAFLSLIRHSKVLNQVKKVDFKWFVEPADLSCELLRMPKIVCIISSASH
jgi:hypothetical protein